MDRALASFLKFRLDAREHLSRSLAADPEFGLDFVPGKGRAARVDTCLNLSSGFGGSNVCSVFKRVT